jgi:hypothetical protein
MFANGGAFDWGTIRANQVAQLKADADKRNAAAKAAYLDQCATWVAVNTISRDRGVTVAPVPVKPLCEVVAADGQSAWIAFTDLPTPVLPPVVVQGSNSLVPTDRPPSNEQMLGAIMQEVLAIKAILMGGK